MPFWPPLIGLKIVPMVSTQYTEWLDKISEKVILGFVKIFRLSKNTSGVQTLYFGLFDRLSLETSWNCLIYNINSLMYRIAQDVLIVYRTVLLVVQLCYFDSIIELVKLTTFYTLSIYKARMIGLTRWACMSICRVIYFAIHFQIRMNLTFSSITITLTPLAMQSYFIINKNSNDVHSNLTWAKHDWTTVVRFVPSSMYGIKVHFPKFTFL